MGLLCWGAMQETIILAVSSIFVNIEPANKTFLNSVGTDQYTLIEQSGDYIVNLLQVVLKFNYYEMHVEYNRNRFISSDSVKSTFDEIMEHNGAQWS